MNIDESAISFEQEAEKLELFGFKYETREDLLIGVRAFYSDKGYALSICGSKLEKYVVLQCDRGGQYRDVRGVPLDEREKTTGTRRINCPFKIKGKKTDEGIWIIEIRNLSHNHEASADISDYHSLRQLSQEDIKKVDHMTRSRIPSRQILSSLRQKKLELKAISKTVYNVKAKIHREKLEGRTIIQALLDELGGGT
ncbi:PKS-NRPS hybrid synthetase cheA-like [Carex rostrata]